MTLLEKPVVRRIARHNLVVRLTVDGLELRGCRRRSSRRVSWAQIASLAGPEHPLLRAAEVQSGNRALREMGATP